MEKVEERYGKPTILVVDDSPDNLTLMGDLLMNDYRIKVANHGEKALKLAGAENPPTLILLDIMMPGMDGYEVCRRLKADGHTQDIPVIFLTALTDMEDEKKGLELGAVDYITKPISPVLFLARIRNQIELAKHREHLTAMVAERTRELEEALNRLKTIDAARRDFLKAISHELRTPVNGVLGIAELALEELTDKEQQATYTDLFERSRNRLIMAIDAALQLADFQSGSLIPTAPVDFFENVTKVWNSLRDVFSARDLSFVAPQMRPVQVLGNEELLCQSLTTLLQTIQRLATPDTPVTAEFAEDSNQVTLTISFQGRPLPDGLQRSIFDTFSSDRTGSYIEDLGLAVPLAAEIIRAMGGIVDLQNTASGVKIQLTLKKVFQ